MNKEVLILTLIQEFILSLVVLIGGGYLVYASPSQTVQTIAISAITAVITFWFSRRLQDASNNNNNNQASAPTQVPAPPAAPSQSASTVSQAAANVTTQAIETVIADPTQLNRHA